MNAPHHDVDAQLATLDDQQIETLWRQALARPDHDELEPLARQLVLRALPAIEGACRMRGERVGMSEPDLAAAAREASVKLMLRLLHHTGWRSLAGLASQLAGEVIADPRRRRSTSDGLFTPARPTLRLLPGAADGPTPGENGAQA